MRKEKKKETTVSENKITRLKKQELDRLYCDGIIRSSDIDNIDNFNNSDNDR